MQELLKKQKKSSKKDKHHSSKKSGLKEEVVPHKLKIKGIVYAGESGNKIKSKDESKKLTDVANSRDNSKGTSREQKTQRERRNLFEDEI